MRVVKILAVRDTREWIEGPDDRWVPVAGSGDARECDRCQREHEVHAEVEYEGGTTAIVGTGCMGQDKETKKRGRSLASGAKTVARHRARAQALSRELRRSLEVEDQVETLIEPKIDTAQERMGGTSGAWYRYRITMGDATVFSLEGVTEERIKIVRQRWRTNRAAELGGPKFRGSQVVVREMVQAEEAWKQASIRFTARLKGEL